MKDNLKREGRRVTELNISLMGISIQDNGKIINTMDTESINTLKDQFIKDFGSIIRNTFLAANHGVTMLNTLVSSKMDSEMGKENLSSMINLTMKAILIMMKSVDKESITGWMAEFMLVLGVKIKCKVTV